MSAGLQGRRALVCGATQGIGWATAKRLAAAGAEVVLLARNPAALQARAQEIGADWRAADFAHPDSVRAVVPTLPTPVHILINNTGGPSAGPIVAADESDFVAAFRAHVVNAQILAQALWQGMKTAGYGRIVNVVSTSVYEPLEGLGVSNTTRAAMAGWAKTWAKETAAYGITVNNVLPGATNTERLRTLIAAKARHAGVSQDRVREAMIKEIPAGRFAEADEIADAIMFFVHSPYVTGVSLPVDGGRMAKI
jgi:3-oxoacyl-[acyl-carrier protein] reductase